MSYQFDLVVIGSGPAGEKGAAQAAYFGKKVALIERSDYLGGTGINTGTVPSKTLRETALYFSGLRQRGLYGIDYSLKEHLTVSDLMHRQQTVVEMERDIVKTNMERHNVEVFRGTARLKDSHTVCFTKPDGSEDELTGEIILIATGSSPFRPAGISFDNLRIYDSDSILRMKMIPKTMVVIGGGVIGCEYACTFSALGVQVTLVESSNRILRFVDSEIADRLRLKLELLGLRFLFNDRLQRAEILPGGVNLELKSGEILDCEIALIAAGRQSNVQGMGLEEAGIQLGERGLIKVNEKYQSAVNNIYAAGDVIGFPALSSVSMEQARVAMVHAFNLAYKESICPVLPLAIYTIPEISLAGLTEDECREKNIPHLVGRSYFEKSPRGQIIGDTSGMLKLVFSPPDKKLLGVHLIGEMSSELVH
ncbi:MAG TPA: Si-specific NAD(P)(+) transhydrogenase, partial [Acidobacteriota bacterium]|nr:Si-specific NAD(P)(+) transhydrogenase [Acidobacteriota bacterium]